MLKQIIQRLRALLGRASGAPVLYVGGGESLPPPLSKGEEEACIRALKEGDPQARKTLIERNLRLVVYVAKRFENTGVGIEDLVGIGAVGLIKAVSQKNGDQSGRTPEYRLGRQ